MKTTIWASGKFFNILFKMEVPVFPSLSQDSGLKLSLSVSAGVSVESNGDDQLRVCTLPSVSFLIKYVLK